MRITALQLENIGVFQQLHIEFPEKTQPDKAEIHIFTGENGTGKSTLLYALATIVDYNFKPLSSRCKLENNTIIKTTCKHKNEENTTIKNISKKSQNFSNYNLSSLPIYRAYLTPYNKDEIPFLLFEFAFFAYSGNRYVESYEIKSIEETNLSPLVNSLDFHHSIDNKVLVQWLANTITKEALEKVQNNHEQAQKYRESITQIEQIVSKIIEKEVKIVLHTQPLAIKIQIGNRLCSIDALPDGVKSILSWVADLLMKLDNLAWENDTPLLERNFILFLDEIEVHLHPAWQRKVLPVVQKLFPNAQIFVSTHSPFVVGSVDGAYVYKFGLDEQGNSHLLQAPTISDTSQSYALILDEIFGVDETFGDNIEKDLDEFYAIRDELLANKKDREPQFIMLTNKLLQKSLETKTLIGSEIRQLNRKLGTSYAL